MKVKIVILLTAIFLVTGAGMSDAAAHKANYAPRANTLTPSRGSALAATPVNFTSSYADNNGYSDIKTAICQVNTSTNRKKAFCGYYNRTTNRLYLYNDAGTGFVPGNGAPGSDVILENSYAKLDCSRTRVGASGKVLVVNWNVTFKTPAVSRTPKKIYLYAADSKNAATGWVQKGTWQVKEAVVAPAADFTADPASGDTPLTVRFTDKTTGSVTSRSWDFGDGVRSTATNPAHAYSLVSPWDVDYQADDLPQDAGAGWTRHIRGTPETESIEAGVLHNKCNYTAGQAAWYDRSADFSAASLYTVEARMRLASFAGISYGAMCLGAYDSVYAWRLDITPNNINLGWSAEYKATYEMDTTSDFHTYRVKVLNGVVSVYVDGVRRMTADMKHTAAHGYPSSVYFGQIIASGVVLPYPPTTPEYIEAYWDHIKIDNTLSQPPSQRYYTVALTATGPGGSNTKTVTNRVNVLAPAPEIFTKGLADGVVNERYAETLYADNGVLPYTWSVVSGSIPSGLSLKSSTGEITGWPSAAGAYEFIVEARDYKGRTDMQAISISVAPYPALTDLQLLWETEAKSAAYFYYEALSNGFVKDSTMNSYCASIGATGFGLAAMCAIANNSLIDSPTSPWKITGAQARERVIQILDNCIAYQNMQTDYGNEYGYGGFLPHFIESDGTCYDNREVSTVDMALFMAGAVTAGEYFGLEVKEKVETIYNKLQWRLFLNIYSKQFSHGWDPKTGSIISQTWDRPGDETILVSVMALGKEPDAMDFLETMYSWPRTVRRYGGYDVVNSYFGSLFTYFFAHCFIDFQGLGQDNPSATSYKTKAPVDWWQNSVNAALANRQFCINNASANPAYGPDSWGLTPCFYPRGWSYNGTFGAAPCEAYGGNPDHVGILAPYGAISCMPFFKKTWDEPFKPENDNLGFRALKHYYTTYYGNLWGIYGPKDSFDEYGYCSYYLGIDVGPQVLMIENYTTGLIWEYFMKNPRMQAALNKIFSK